MTFFKNGCSGKRIGSINHKKPKISGGRRGPGPPDTLLFNLVHRGISQTGRIKQNDRIAREIQIDLDDIARRPGGGRSDSRGTPSQRTQGAYARLSRELSLLMDDL